METTKLEVSLETYKRIEAKRLTFKESHDDILKRLLSLSTTTEYSPILSQKRVVSHTPRQTRTSGAYSIWLLGEEIAETSITRSLTKLIEKLHSMDNTFMERLSEAETRGRRIISRVPEKLYKKSPHLADDYAEPFGNGWYIDSNISHQQYIARLKIISNVAGLKFGTDIKELKN